MTTQSPHHYQDDLTYDAMNALPGVSSVHLMVDIETESANKNARVFEVAIRPFTLNKIMPATVLIPGETWQDARHRDPKTREWWMHPARSERFEELVELGKKGLGKDDFLAALGKSMQGTTDKGLLWARGQDFDLGILATFYENAGQPVPWKFWLGADARTILRCTGTPAQAADHTAAYDTFIQAQDTVRAMRKLIACGAAPLRAFA